MNDTFRETRPFFSRAIRSDFRRPTCTRVVIMMLLAKNIEYVSLIPYYYKRVMFVRVSVRRFRDRFI